MGSTTPVPKTKVGLFSVSSAEGLRGRGSLARTRDGDERRGTALGPLSSFPPSKKTENVRVCASLRPLTDAFPTHCHPLQNVSRVPIPPPPHFLFFFFYSPVLTKILCKSPPFVRVCFFLTFLLGLLHPPATTARASSPYGNRRTQPLLKGTGQGGQVSSPSEIRSRAGAASIKPACNLRAGWQQKLGKSSRRTASSDTIGGDWHVPRRGGSARGAAAEPVVREWGVIWTGGATETMRTTTRMVNMTDCEGVAGRT